MKHFQTRLNADGTICVDYYNEELYTFETAQTIKKTAEYIEKLTGKQIRRFPFSVTHCDSCGHPIVTNRDYLDMIRCRNCGESFQYLPQTSETNQALLKSINDAMGYRLQNCNAYRAYILVFIPEQVDVSNLSRIMRRFGFTAAHCGGEIYEMLLNIGADQGWLSPDCRVAFSKTVLDERDCILDDKIPRVEACARFLTNYISEQINTVSIHLRPEIENDAPIGKGQSGIKMEIEQLTAEGKIEEALKLLEQL